MGDKGEEHLKIPADFNGDVKLFTEVASNLPEIIFSRVKTDDLPPTVQELKKFFDQLIRVQYEESFKRLFVYEHHMKVEKVGATIRNFKEKSEGTGTLTSIAVDRPLEEAILQKKKDGLLKILKQVEENCDDLQQQIVEKRENFQQLPREVLQNTILKQ